MHFNVSDFSLRKCKAIVVACNTASAAGLDLIQQSFDLPIIGVVEPGAVTACRVTNTKRLE